MGVDHNMELGPQRTQQVTSMTHYLTWAEEPPLPSLDHHSTSRVQVEKLE